jgi:uncharacterized membrane protein YdfJ with MMPL/SSD domain
VVLRRRLVSLAVVIATAAALAVVAPQLRFTTAITHFLPDASDPRNAQVAGLLANGESTRVMVLDLTMGPSAGTPALHAATEALIAFLRGRPDVESAQSGVTDRDAAASSPAFPARPSCPPRSKPSPWSARA